MAWYDLTMHVFLLAAITLDGRIARHEGDKSFDWTSPEDKQFYVSKIKTADAIVMGRSSFETFTRYPKGSRWVIYTSKPDAFVNPKPEVIRAEGTAEAPRLLLKRLEAEGCQNVAICGGASVYTQFMEAGVVNTLFLTVEPVIFGQGVALFNKAVGGLMGVHLQLREVHPLAGSTQVLEYEVVKSHEDSH